jgi:hypothetical protein
MAAVPRPLPHGHVAGLTSCSASPISRSMAARWRWISTPRLRAVMSTCFSRPHRDRHSFLASSSALTTCHRRRASAEYSRPRRTSRNGCSAISRRAASRRDRHGSSSPRGSSARESSSATTPASPATEARGVLRSTVRRAEAAPAARVGPPAALVAGLDPLDRGGARARPASSSEPARGAQPRSGSSARRARRGTGRPRDRRPPARGLRRRMPSRRRVSPTA